MKRNWLKVFLIYCLMLASLPAPTWASPALVLAVSPLPTFLAAPVATSFSVTASTVGNKPITLQGSDADNTPLTFTLLSQPAHGAISNFNASTGALIYTPAFGYTGADSFTFRVSSGGQDSNTATVSITVAADKTRIIDYVTDVGGVGQVGKVTFVLTTTASTGGGLISPASSVTAQTDATGKYDTSVIASANLSPKSYYQVYFQSNYSDRRLLGIYDIPVSATPIVLQSYKVTDTNLAARYTFADKASVDSLQAANANAVFQSLVPAGATDGQVFSYDATTQRLKTAPIRDDGTKLQLTRPIASLTADAATVTGNQTVGGNVTANSFTGNGAALTGIVGTGTGGTDSTGSVSIIADKDGANPSAVIEGLVGPAGSRVSVFRSDENGFDLLKGLPRSTRSGLPAAGNPGRFYKLTDDFRGLAFDTGAQWIELGGRIFDVRSFGASASASAAANVTAINAALSAITTAGGGTLEISEGNYSVNAAIALPSNCRLRGNGTIRQTTNNTSIFTITNKSNILIEGLNFVGVGSDFNNTITDPAQAINASGVVTGLTVHNCTFTNFANAAIRAKGARLKFTNLTIVGPGLAVITPVTHGGSYGIAIESNTEDVYIAGCTISETAQGIASGQNIKNIRIIANHLFNIRGQHSIYLGGGGLVNVAILGNTSFNSRLIGIKVQADDAAGAHCYNIAIVGNTIEKAGGGGIAVQTGTYNATYKVYNVNVSNNTIYDDCPDDALNLINVIDGVVANNTMKNIDREGGSFTNVQGLLAVNNYMKDIAASGFRVYENSGTSNEIDFIDNRITNPATSNRGSSTGNAGIRVSAGNKINYRGNIIVDNNAKCEYGIFRENGNQTNDHMVDNIVLGITQYSARVQSGSNLAMIRDNYFPRGILNEPTALQRGSRGRVWYGTAAPTTDSWAQGDIVYNISPSAGGHLGWVCVASGAPGTWKTFGAIAP